MDAIRDRKQVETWFFLHDLDKCLEDPKQNLGFLPLSGADLWHIFGKNMRKYAVFVKNGRKKFFSIFFK